VSCNECVCKSLILLAVIFAACSWHCMQFPTPMPTDARPQTVAADLVNRSSRSTVRQKQDAC
jgi:hypothetical protein